MCNIKSIASLLAIIVLFNMSAYSAKKNYKSPPQPKQTSIVVNMQDGSVAHFDEAHQKIYPASLTKLMTIYLAFDALQKGKLRELQKLKTSKAAAKMKPCKLGLGVGQKITVSQAIDALIVRSANDAAVVLAEAVAGDEKRFARLMTRKARKLGMSSTTFKNASGWHHKNQKTTAIDMAKLAIALKRDFPQHYSRFAKTKFVFNGNTIYSHNKVTKHYEGAEGMKTGYTSHAGYNLVTTASRGGKSLVAVVTGGTTSVKRNKKVMSLLDKGFASKADNIQIASASNRSKRSHRTLVTNTLRKQDAPKKVLSKPSKRVASHSKPRSAFSKLNTQTAQSVKSLSKRNHRKKLVKNNHTFQSRKVKPVSGRNQTRVASNGYDAFSMLGS